MKICPSYRVMQYNVLHQKEGWGPVELLVLGLEARKNNVERAIRTLQPDILLLAERHDEWNGAGDSGVNLSADLSPEYAFVQNSIFCEGIVAVNRVPIAYRTEVFRCVDSGFLKLMEEASFQNSNNKRVVTWAVLEDITDTDAKGQRIAVFCTHWSGGEHLQPFRQHQATQTQNLIKQLLMNPEYRNLPIVVGGDFNADYHSAEYQSLLKGCELTDADVNFSRIDRIAVSGACVVAFQAQIVPNASDHHPIYCDIKIETNGGHCYEAIFESHN